MASNEFITSGNIFTPDTASIFDKLSKTFGTAPQRELLEKQKLKEADIEDARDLIIGGTDAEQEEGLIRITNLQGAQVGNAIRGIIESGDARKLAGLQKQSDEFLRSATFIKSFKDPVKRQQAINAEFTRLGSLGVDNSNLVELSNKTHEQQDVLLDQDIIAGTDISELSKQELKRLEVAQKGTFSDVLNEKGQIVAQVNDVTGEVKKSPLAVGAEGGEKATFKQGGNFLVKKADGSSEIVTMVTDSRSGVTVAKRVDAGGKIIDRSFGETGKEKSARLVEQTGGQERAKLGAQIDLIGNVEKVKARTKGAEARVQDRISDGLNRAESLPSLNRAIELMDLVSTGGFEKAKLKAKQFLGVESADEAEITNNLGKIVLPQLKKIFGSAFTAEEGKLLIAMEAGLGKSTAGNKRLLNQAKKLMTLSAKKGMKAAADAGDFETAQEIKEFMEFKLTPGADQDLSKVSNDDLLKRFGG